MKNIIIAFGLFVCYCSCSHKSKPVTDQFFIDSLLNNYTESALQRSNRLNLTFWKEKNEKAISGYTEMQQYAGTLAARFHLYGDIRDLKNADSIIQKLNFIFKESDAGLLRTMSGHAITEHRFKDAYDCVQKALALGSDRYISESLNFDAAFELGQIPLSAEILKRLKSSNEYGYFFRLSKYEHFKGDLDSSIAAMKKAAMLAGNNTALLQTAISNTADLYLHAADAGEANENYMQSIRLDASDLHSIMGIGWLALVHDKNDTLAEKIFKFVQTKTKSPDVLLKLAQVAEQRADSISEKKYLQQFVDIVSDSVYGDMYNKYLIDLYSNFLQEPGKAVAIAEKEIKNRATPQTYSWYVWSLFKNNQQEKAINYYDKFVSGKPLEGLELYYMGKMMKALNKGYNATQYFKAAYNNRFDLGPAKQKDLEGLMND